MVEWVRDRAEGVAAASVDGIRALMVGFYRAHKGLCDGHLGLATAADVPRAVQDALGAHFDVHVGGAYGEDGDAPEAQARGRPRRTQVAGPQSWRGVCAAVNQADPSRPAGAHPRGGGR